MVDQVFHAAEFGYQLFGSHFANPGYPRNVIRAVTPDTKDIDDLLRAFNSEFLTYLFRTPDLRLVSELGRLIDQGSVTYKLSEIFVRCHHISEKSLFLRFFCQGTDN